VTAPDSPDLALVSGSTDRAGQVINWTILAGTTKTAIVTFSRPYPSPLIITLVCPASASFAASSEEEIRVSSNLTGFTVSKANVAGPTLTGSFNYAVLEVDFVSPSSSRLA